MRIRVLKPRDGWEEFDVPTALLGARAGDITKALAAKGLVLQPGVAKLEQGYLIDWWNKIQEEADALRTVKRMGWQKDGAFICGDRKYLPSGKVDKVQLHETIASQASGFALKGSLDVWKTIAAAYNKPQMEPYQFAVACGFGAPLMQLAAEGNYAGAFIHMTSQRGGQGKTTAQNVALSVYGRPDELTLRAPDGKRGGDTELAVFGRIGTYSSLPVVLDETTNAPAHVMSNMAYQITSGRARIRSKQDGTENKHDSEWRTLALASGNSSAITRIAAFKPGANAEALRIFEFEVISPGLMTKLEADRVFPLTSVNYGVAGDAYLSWLVSNRDEAVRIVGKFCEMVDKEAGIGSDERFWGVTAGVTMAGIFIANKLQLVEYDVGSLFRWTVQRIYQMRDMLKVTVQSPLTSLLAFINDHADRILSISAFGGQMVPRNERLVHAPLVGRIEPDTGLLWVSTRALQNYCVEQQTELRNIERELESTGALKATNMRKQLSEGSTLVGLPERCMMIDLTKTEIAGNAVHVVEKTTQEVYA
jgi:hypothetical protein